ncbi:hypothetical protein EII29_06945 [Leptotrichia sp. OH3620_COT-345]|uniref:hypothetical protein n=1 Tax=Leptotrichia sp. OH3620_COT-345 TaxID=2491048 RepID=UPI000F645920|nr:hypothetical protein [Leptotrichia sp. OH3620_COT-345]RRD39542.1 hypothetical protein EII29_06945 [Leptotrichia sp. OH3620_COT-345]
MKKRNKFLGILGLLIGVIPGIILYVIASRLRIFASITVVAIFYGSIFGGSFFSNLFSGESDENEINDGMKYYEEEDNLSKGTVALATLFSLIGVYIAEVLDYTLSIVKEYPEVPFSEAFNFSLTDIFQSPVYLLISCVIVLFIGVSSMIKAGRN